MAEDERLAAEFGAHRAYLLAIAFRVLGSHADADDAVQEAWLRLARTGGGAASCACCPVCGGACRPAA